MYKIIIAIIRHERLDDVVAALKKERIHFTFSEVKGFGKEAHLYYGDIHSRIRLEIVAEAAVVSVIKDLLLEKACCGHAGDGIYAVCDLEDFLDFSEVG